MASGFFPQNPSTTIARSLLVTYWNSGTGAAPQWEPIGYHCDDSAISFEMESDTSTDILGNQYSTAGVPKLSQSLDPLPIMTGTVEKPNKFQEKIHDILLKGNYNQLSNAFDFLIVYYYAGPNTGNNDTCDAQRWPQSSIEVGDLGGSAEDALSQGVTVHFGGTREYGTVVKADDGTITYTKTA